MNTGKQLLSIILVVGIAILCVLATKKLVATAAPEKNQPHMEQLEQFDVLGEAQLYLLHAATERNVKLLKLMLRIPRIDVNFLDYRGFGALMLTIIPNGIKHCRDTECLDMLLAHPDINVNIERPEGYPGISVTPLILAVNWDHRKAVDALLKHRNCKGELDLNINQLSYHSTKKDEKTTALMQAARLGRKELVERLLADERLDLRSNDQGLRAIAEADECISDEAANHLYHKVGTGLEIQKLIKAAMEKQEI